jgi:HD-GYP domain-containing protein (c-di-GMP phosphodiesterase class II)
MRLVPINSVKEGSFLAKTIFDNDGRILLRDGVKLTEGLIRRIKSIGIFTLYINDEYSYNVIEDVIEPHIRQKAIKSVKDTFSHFERFNSAAGAKGNLSGVTPPRGNKQDYVKALMDLSKEIMDEMISKKNVLINLVDIKSLDNYTYQHSVNVALLSLVLGIKLKLSKYELYNLCVGAILHDIGKVFIPTEILLKKDKLTDSEFELIKEHTFRGYEYLKTSPDIPATARIVVLQHHEKVNGKGYPEMRKKDEINKLSKIVAITDVYDALTSDRAYRRAMSPNEAIEYIMASGESHFDFEMVKVFAKTIIPYPEGSLVKLSDGRLAVVEKLNSEFPLRPIIRLINNNNKLVDLEKELHIVITGLQYEVVKQEL